MLSGKRLCSQNIYCKKQIKVFKSWEKKKNKNKSKVNINARYIKYI